MVFATTSFFSSSSGGRGRGRAVSVQSAVIRENSELGSQTLWRRYRGLIPYTDSSVLGTLWPCVASLPALLADMLEETALFGELTPGLTVEIVAGLVTFASTRPGIASTASIASSTSFRFLFGLDPGASILDSIRRDDRCV